MLLKRVSMFYLYICLNNQLYVYIFVSVRPCSSVWGYDTKSIKLLFLCRSCWYCMLNITKDCNCKLVLVYKCKYINVWSCERPCELENRRVCYILKTTIKRCSSYICMAIVFLLHTDGNLWFAAILCLSLHIFTILI